MTAASIEADYLVVGAGATGMAFVDTLLTDGDATVVMVDRNDRPGGHWTHAYPFVRLHQPASTYGVNSHELGTGAKDQVGLNQGLYELASGQEVQSHFDEVMRQRFLPSGRVRYFPMSDHDGDGTITSLVSGAQQQVRATTVVDATYSRMLVPSTSPPNYEVGEEVACVPVNDLPRRAAEFGSYVIVGGGKTGMDACIWLLQNGADPDSIRWIVPRDSWVLNRSNLQPGPEFFTQFCKSLADQVEAIALGDSVDDVFARLEAADEVRRIDPAVQPEAYHCAIVSDGELEELRRIHNVVRRGRIASIGRSEIVLEGGAVPTDQDTLHVDCSAAGIPSRPVKPIFEPGRITLQWIRICQPTFSAALIGHVEANFEDMDVKNQICTPLPPPTVPRDWLTIMQVELENRRRWSTTPEVEAWISESRLEFFAKTARTELGVNEEATAHVERYLTNVGPAVQRLDELVGSGG